MGAKPVGLFLKQEEKKEENTDIQTTQKTCMYSNQGKRGPQPKAAWSRRFRGAAEEFADANPGHTKAIIAWSTEAPCALYEVRLSCVQLFWNHASRNLLFEVLA